MGTDALELVAVILVLVVGLASVTVYGLVKLAQVRAQRPTPALPADDAAARMEVLEQEVTDLREQLAFSERLLARRAPTQPPQDEG